MVLMGHLQGAKDLCPQKTRKCFNFLALSANNDQRIQQMIHEKVDKFSFTKKAGQTLEEVVQESLEITTLLSVPEMCGCGT